MNLNHVYYKYYENLSQIKNFTSGQIFIKFRNAVAKSTAEPENSNFKTLANTSTPFNIRAFFVRSLHTPKERPELQESRERQFIPNEFTKLNLKPCKSLSMVACNGKGSPFAVFQSSQFLSPLHVTAQTLRSLAVAPQCLTLELSAMIYLFKAVSRRDLRNTTKPIHSFPCYTLRIKAESLEQAKSIVCPLFAVMGVVYA
ncbi:ash family protein [Actinobacillus equuli subsp. equuli]|uniref:ash family protein n=1 Tax=Actinobacillus equuli TaxID=718 RepID=UPI0024412E68|nr:ash family protein [Actinobacillus equuli]WGE65914.1 ash family protein [Actinobacillus equuli subsp. equuli]